MDVLLQAKAFASVTKQKLAGKWKEDNLCFTIIFQPSPNLYSVFILLVMPKTGKYGRSFHLLILFSTHNAEKSNAMPKTQEMAALAMMPSCCVKPATTNVRNDTVATVMAYGNCDDTW